MCTWRLAPRRGAVSLPASTGGLRFARPPATFSQPSGLHRSTLKLELAINQVLGLIRQAPHT